jgi:alkylhydroperoxidase family enzyme
MARIEYPDPATLSERTQKALDRMPPLNVFRMLSHADTAFVHFLRMTGGLWTEAELSPRKRELAILHVAQLTEAEYEWFQHIAIARVSDVTQAEIDSIEAGNVGAPDFGEADAALLAMTGAIVTQTRSNDATFEAARAHLSSRELVELHLVVGAYVALARLMTNLELELDDQQAAALVGERP